MLNTHTVNLIQYHKNEILNHLGQKLYVSIMTNKVNPKLPQWDLRRSEHGHAHLAACTYTGDLNFKSFDQIKYYYITSSIYDVNYDRCLTFREDLVLSWGHSSVSDVYVLALDLEHNQLYDIPVAYIVDLYNNKQCTIKRNREKLLTTKGNREYTFSNFKYAAFNLELFQAEELNSLEYCGSYDKNYLHPQYIGNTVYAKYRSDYTCYLTFYDTDGNRTNFSDDMSQYRSLKEAYDVLKRVAKIDISYKTFQRRCAANKPIVTAVGNIIYVTREPKSDRVVDVSTVLHYDNELGLVYKDDVDFENEIAEEFKSKEKKQELVDEIDQMSDGVIEEIDDFEDETVPSVFKKYFIGYCERYKLTTALKEVKENMDDIEMWQYYYGQFKEEYEKYLNEAK